MSMHTPEELLALDSPPRVSPEHRTLSLGMRSTRGLPEGAGAIVEADGNMLVSKNGYPVYASVHMNDTYFEFVKKNLIITGAYQANARDAREGPNKEDSIPVGAVVFKATWLRLDEKDSPPPGAFVTEALVPRLSLSLSADNTLYAAPDGRTVKVKVALVGLHVVGRTVDHPEFVWGTFEHKSNSPRFADGTYDPLSTASNPGRDYTFYTANTPYVKTNLPSTQTTATSTPLSTPLTTINLVATPTYRFDPATQKFSPSTNVVLANETGGETPRGALDIANLNRTAHAFFSKTGSSSPTRQPGFANYDLIGTVWMKPGSLTLDSDQSQATGSVNLANSTAETFEQNLSGKTGGGAELLLVSQPEDLPRRRAFAQPSRALRRDEPRRRGGLALRGAQHALRQGTARSPIRREQVVVSDSHPNQG